MRSIASMLALLLCLPVGADGPGVHRGASATFRARHTFTITVPAGAGRVDAWLAMPHLRDPAQQVWNWTVDSELPHRVVFDARGNNFLHVTSHGAKPGTYTIATSFIVTRWETKADVDPKATRPHTEAELLALAADLLPSSQSVITADIRAFARKAVADETNPVTVARQLYAAVLERIDYHVKDPRPDAQKTMKSSGTGSSIQTYQTCTGNCTDFHSLYAAMARSLRLPTRAVYGSFFKGPLNGKDTDQSYHCWLEVHAPNIGWIPLDVAVGDVFSADFKANEHSRPRAHLTVADGYAGPDEKRVWYYFGNLEARRVTWHRGRDLRLPGMRSRTPLLWNPKCYVEVDGRPAKGWTRKLTFTELAKAKK